MTTSKLYHSKTQLSTIRYLPPQPLHHSKMRCTIVSLIASVNDNTCASILRLNTQRIFPLILHSLNLHSTSHSHPLPTTSRLPTPPKAASDTPTYLRQARQCWSLWYGDKLFIGHRLVDLRPRRRGTSSSTNSCVRSITTPICSHLLILSPLLHSHLIHVVSSLTIFSDCKAFIYKTYCLHDRWEMFDSAIFIFKTPTSIQFDFLANKKILQWKCFVFIILFTRYWKNRPVVKSV